MTAENSFHGWNSFVGFTSMVVMQDLGISEVFTGDRHFLQVNIGFQLVP